MNEQYYVKNCMDCGGNTTVTDSRNKNGAIWRKRKCNECGYSFTTVEVEECMLDNFDLIEEMKNLHNQIRELKDKIANIKKIVEV